MAEDRTAHNRERGDEAIRMRLQSKWSRLRSPFSWLERTRRTAADRDHARSERDAAQRALKAARAERDAAREALAAAEAEATERGAQLEMLVEPLLAQTGQAIRLAKDTNTRVRLLHRELLTDIQALSQLLNRYSPEARLPPIAGWALSPVGLLALTDAIEARRARTVVECGSGTSTLWIAYALKRLGQGKVIAVEHLSEYADKTRGFIEAHGLNDFVEVRQVPLVARETPRGELLWYGIDPTSLPEPIDVLLVDGPPGSTGRHARYPALSVLRDRLAPNAVIVVDDTERADEREILEQWMQDEPRLRPVESPGPGIEVLELFT